MLGQCLVVFFFVALGMSEHEIRRVVLATSRKRRRVVNFGIANARDRQKAARAHPRLALK
jgi:hypothetical protein